MRAISFILAFVLVAATSSMAGTPQGSLPNAGLFAFDGGSQVVSTHVVVASR
jgi:hypothetical protein